MVRLFALTVLIGVGFYLAIYIFFVSQQERFLFPAAPWRPSDRLGLSPSALELDMKLHDFDFDFAGQRQRGVWIEAVHARGLMIYFHGNGGNLYDWVPVAEAIARETRMDVVLADYPGYGESSGKIQGEADLVEWARVLRAEVDRRLPRTPVGYYARSIGTGIAMDLAAIRPPDFMILETPIYKMSEVVHAHFKWIPTWGLRYQFDSTLSLSKGNYPLWVVHGTADETIPFEQGQRVVEFVDPARVHFTAIDGGLHNTLGESADYWRELKSFIDRIFSSTRTA